MQVSVKRVIISAVAGAAGAAAVVGVLALASGTVAAANNTGLDSTAPAARQDVVTSTKPFGRGRFTGTHEFTGTKPFGKDWFSVTHQITGTIVVSVVPGSPADAAGIKPGDVIVAVDSQTITNPKSLPEAITAKKVGDQVALEVKGSDGLSRDLTATLAENPNKAGTAYLGVFTRPFGPFGGRSGDHDGFDKRPRGPGRGQGRGVFTPTATIAEVMSGSPADVAGLKAGDVINEINGSAVNTPADVKKAVSSAKVGDKLALKITRDNASQTIEVTLGENPNQKDAPYLGIVLGFGGRPMMPRPAPKTPTTTG